MKITNHGNLELFSKVDTDRAQPNYTVSDFYMVSRLVDVLKILLHNRYIVCMAL